MVGSIDQFTLLFSSLSAKMALFHSVCEQARSVKPNCKIIGVDSDQSCRGAKQIDSFLIIPPIQDLDQESLLQFCKEN